MKIKKTATRKKRIHLPKGFTIDPNMPDYSNDPVIKKKVDEAKADFRKFPPPDFRKMSTIKERHPKLSKLLK